MKHIELHIDQPAGSGQGYFIEQNFPGIDALVQLNNYGRTTLRLIITKYNAPEVSVDVPPHTEYAIETPNIQTVGIFVVPGHHRDWEWEDHDCRDKRDPYDRRHDDCKDKHDRHDCHDKHDKHDKHDRHERGKGRLIIIPNFRKINL